MDGGSKNSKQAAVAWSPDETKAYMITHSVVDLVYDHLTIFLDPLL